MDRYFLLNHIKSKLENYIDPISMPIVLAVTVGEKQYLTSEIRNIYSSGGVMHVLAVSGLHVGIFVLILSSLLHKTAYVFSIVNTKLYPINSKSSIQGYSGFAIISPFIIPVILLFVIWLYAFIAGLSPSIVRSAIMFSVFQISSIFKRKGSIYSSLALSAMIMLLVNPLIIHNVGFQLSFLAVLSIVYFYPKLKAFFIQYHIYWFHLKMFLKSRNTVSKTMISQIISSILCISFSPSTSSNLSFFMVDKAAGSNKSVSSVLVSNGIYKNIIILFKRILGYLCDIAIISISAQILTLPILVYYFKKFSLYFIIANCIMIPSVFWVILLSLILICISSFPSIASVVGYMISKIISVSTFILKYISKWPYSEIHISFDIIDVFGYYSILFMLILLLKFKKFVYLILLNITVLVYSILKTIYYIFP